MSLNPKFCGNCGVPLEEEARFCGECGSMISEFNERDQKTASKEEPPQSPPHTPEAETVSDASSANIQKKGISWPQSTSSRVCWVCGIFFILVFSTLIGGAGGSLINYTLLLFVVLFVGKAIAGRLNKKQ